jgi:hypothetical protein
MVNIMAEKFDFIGHVTYPWNEKTQQMFFLQTEVTVYNVSRGNKLLARGIKASDQAISILIKMGYTIEPIKRVHEYAKKTIKSVKLTAHKEGKMGDPDGLLILVKARTAREMSAHTDKLVDYVEKEIGIRGITDIYGKMELC